MAKILVVDDEPNNRLLLAAILEPAGYAVVEAASGDDALRLAKEDHPDLIVMDLLMPGMSGADLIKALRLDPGLTGVEIALYTATVANPDLTQFMEMHGISRVIPKPSEPLEVLALVNAIFAKPGAG